ncbi:6-phosphogluconolactonase [Actinomyces sp.]|uniref:6-phosphogluconolactonase n=1 Tax=Actinomyces sp. TaxID=29317 RepID=UPI0025BBCC28|nr:6-phosphogluconolactonase [Actinomyces sp.]
MVAVHTLEILPTVEELNEAVGRAFLARLSTLVDEAEVGSRINLAISGGAVTTSLLPSLLPRVGDVDWSRVRVWLVDERFVPAGHADRNDDQAWEGFFHAASGVELVRMPTSDESAPGAGSLDAATSAFEATWTELMGSGSFDIALIGMGPDGHICSLFPGRVDLEEPSPILAIRNSPKPPPERITVSMPVMRACGEVWLTTAGSAKADALGRAFAGASPLDIPVAGVLTPTTRVYLDEPAAASIATLAP